MKNKGIPEFNIAVMGSKGVGKTSYIQRFLNNSYVPSYQPTHNVAEYTKVFDLKGDKSQADPRLVILRIYDMQNPVNQVSSESYALGIRTMKSKQGNEGRWEKDPSDQDMFDGFPKKNLKDTIHAYLFLFAVDDPQSLTMTVEEYEQVRAKQTSQLRHAESQNPFRSKKFVVATKQDNRYAKYNVLKNFEEGSKEEKFIRGLDPAFFFESSAMANHRVEKVFKEAGNLLFREKREFVMYLQRGKQEQNKKTNIKKDSSTSSKGYWCCSGRAGPESMTLKNLEDEEEEEEQRKSASERSVSAKVDPNRSIELPKMKAAPKPSRCYIF